MVLLLLVFTAAVFTFEVTKAAELDTGELVLPGKSDKTATIDLSSPKPTVEQSVTNLKSDDIAQSSGIPKEITSNKLENDIRNILKNEPGLYSIAYQNTDSKNKLTINPKKMPAASVIKLFIMIETYNQIIEGRINENDKISLTSTMKVGGTGSLSGRKDGTVLTIDQLINLMITQSDNTAANILIDRLTMDQINKTANKLGCLDTIIQRKMMDFKAQNEGKDNFTSVEDLSTILMKIYANKCLGEKYDQKMIEILKQQENKTKIPRLLPAGTVVAHKTGELDRVENDTGIIFTNEGVYLLCILSDDVEADKARMVIAKVSRIVYDYIVSETKFP
jgi:Beta-lactamase class A